MSKDSRALSTPAGPVRVGDTVELAFRGDLNVPPRLGVVESLTRMGDLAAVYVATAESGHRYTASEFDPDSDDVFFLRVVPD